MFGNFELKGDFGDGDVFAGRKDVILKVTKEANEMAFVKALLDDGNMLRAMLVTHAKEIKDVIAKELEQLVIPLLFAERDEKAVGEFMLEGVDEEDVESFAEKLGEFLREAKKTVNLFAQVIDEFPELAGAEFPVAGGAIDEWLAVYRSEVYDVGLLGISLLVAAVHFLGDGEAVGAFAHGFPHPVRETTSRAMRAYKMLYEEFAPEGERALAEMKRRLYNSL